VASSIASVATQEQTDGSLLKVYQAFAQARNTYPALAEGTMTKHATYNDTNTTDKQIAAWYMTKGSQRMLVIHNFGSSQKDVSIADNISKAVCKNGDIQRKTENDTTTLRMAGYSSVVFLLQ